MRGGDEALYIRQGAVIRVDAAIVGDVVAIIQPWRWIERQQPDGVHAEIGDVVQPRDQPGEIADAIIVSIKEGFDMDLIDDRVFIPQRIGIGGLSVALGNRRPRWPTFILSNL